MSEHNLKELYTRKGELTTQIEIFQFRLREVNEAIAKIINAAPQKESKNDSLFSTEP
jgi:hypothetical protein